MILVIDNYDSFTYNLVHYLNELGAETLVYRNDALTVQEALGLKPQGVLLSPGPKTPTEAGICLGLIGGAPDDLPILGVCLGHQAIGESFGGTLVNLSTVFHGVATPINIRQDITFESDDVFYEVPTGLEVGRYHSWVVSDKSFPESLEVTATDNNGYIMGLRHKNFDVQGVQFHPESVLTPSGEQLMRNWLKT